MKARLIKQINGKKGNVYLMTMKDNIASVSLKCYLYIHTKQEK